MVLLEKHLHFFGTIGMIIYYSLREIEIVYDKVEVQNRGYVSTLLSLKHSIKILLFF